MAEANEALPEQRMEPPEELDGPLRDDRIAHLGVDVGGTFTDMVVFSHGENPRCYKIRSTPQRPALATLKGIDEIAKDGRLPAARLGSLHHTHGSTIGVNALIERTGPKLGLITTVGFRDLFELGRLAIPHPMRFDSRRPLPLIPRARCLEISARLSATGEELVPVNRSEVEAAATALLAKGTEVIVVCLLHSYWNSSHERLVREIIRDRFPSVMVDLSSDVWPQSREFERGVLTSINAYVRPATERYLNDLAEGLRARGVTSDAAVTRSNGGKQSVGTIIARPIAALLSGPAAGVVAAAAAAREVGWAKADLITVDVGGTSADVGVVQKGDCVLSSEEHIANFPLITPTIAVSSVGAGGGSIIWLDETGALKVGPRSVGAEPGPACYGDGKLPALTDAFVAAGWLEDGHVLGGRIRLQASQARASLAPIAEQLGLDVERVADGAIAVAIAVMAAETSNVIARRGVDAETFTLVAFGGAGPLIGAMLADEVNIRRLLIPPTPGALSAVGAAYADVQGDLIAPVYARSDAFGGHDLRRVCMDLIAMGEQWLEGERRNLPIASRAFVLSADMRYVGQGYDVTVPFERAWAEREDISLLESAFHEAHQSAYGHSNPGAKVWINELRVHVVGKTPKPPLMPVNEGHGAVPVGARRIRCGGEVIPTNVYRRETLGAGDLIAGPAIVDQYDTTTLVPRGWTAEVAGSGSLVMTAT